MGVYQREGSTFWYVWLDGARKPRLCTFIPIGTTAKQKKESRAKAEQVYFTKMIERANVKFGMPVEKPTRTFLEHRTWYETHVTALKRSKRGEVSILKQLGQHFDDYELKAIDRALVLEWRAARAKTLKGSSIRRQESVLRHILASAIPTYLETHPLVGLPYVRSAPTDTRVLSRDEETRLLAVLTKPVDRAIVIGALDTLLRLSNIAGLTRQQDHGTFLFSDTKVGAVRVPISSRLRVALDAVPATERFFFPRYASDTSGVRKMFQKACEAADVATGRKTGGISFHCLRHTGATRMLAAGVDMETVRKLGGWQNLHVLRRYLHPSDAAGVAAVEAIGGA